MVLNGIVLINQSADEFKRGVITDVNVASTAVERLRPADDCTVAARLPPGVHPDGDGAEVQRPLPTVVIGGLLIATISRLWCCPLCTKIFQRQIDMKKQYHYLIPLLPILVSYKVDR